MVCVAAVALPGALSAAPSAVAAPLKLHVQLNVPPAWNTFNTFQLEDDFVDGVGQLLRRSGFRHTVENITTASRGEKTPYVLTINLREWRTDRSGLVDCTFDATLASPRGTRHLGTYHGNAFHMQGTGRWALAQEFDEAASEALNRLCRDIIRSELLRTGNSTVA